MDATCQRINYGKTLFACLNLIQLHKLLSLTPFSPKGLFRRPNNIVWTRLHNRLHKEREKDKTRYYGRKSDARSTQVVYSM